MDDIFDSLIYILITLAAFAISLLGKKKKPAQRPSGNFNSEDRSDKEQNPFFADFERLLDNDYSDEYDIGKEQAPVEEQETIHFSGEEKSSRNQVNNEILDTVPEELLDGKEAMPYSIEHDDTSEIFSKSIKDEDLTASDEESVMDDFDLEKAVIYSEIINRKDY
ncbi:MAG: hypothetical protein ACLFVR_06125 [Thiohalospira sp.]